MPEPGLSEILNFNADPQRGTGTPAVVYDSNNLINTLNDAAQYRAENVWRKYNMFMGNLKEVYKDLNEIAKQPILTEDREKIKGGMAQILKKISADPQGFFGGGGKYQETLGEIAKLQTDVTESKQNALYDEAHRQYFYANPELDTQENRLLLDGFRKQQLGQRSPYLLKLPGLFDAKAIADSLKISTEKKFSEDAYSPDKKNLITTSGIIYDPGAWESQKKAFFDQSDKRGNPLRETITQRWNSSPELQRMYATPYEYYSASVDAYKPQNQLSTSMKESDIYMNERRIQAQAAESAKNRALTRSLSGGGPKTTTPPVTIGNPWEHIKTQMREHIEKINSKKMFPGQIGYLNKNYTGTYTIPSSEIAGLDIGFEGNKSAEGKDFGLLVTGGGKPVDVTFELKDGIPVSYTIAGVKVSEDTYNEKAYERRNRSLSGKGDIDPLNPFYQNQAQQFLNALNSLQ
jgi:hypothetical protein